MPCLFRNRLFGLSRPTATGSTCCGPTGHDDGAARALVNPLPEPRPAVRTAARKARANEGNASEAGTGPSPAGKWRGEGLAGG
jgi:hypothetical protein